MYVSFFFLTKSLMCVSNSTQVIAEVADLDEEGEEVALIRDHQQVQWIRVACHDI